MLMRGVVLEVRTGRGPAAHRAGAGGMPDLGQVPQLDPGVVAGGLEPVVAGVQGDRVDRDEQGQLAGDAGGQPPGAVSARRAGLAGGGEGEGESGVRGPGWPEWER
jgi:hypothetical protein